eukprot:GEMP01041420.1.p1 GENE.GEMP01041420.1~~GEMP01041420.1.p1  ORF type:complete len:252 (+),score=42.36 GEMP01041420.1:118-873(+)
MKLLSLCLLASCAAAGSALPVLLIEEGLTHKIVIRKDLYSVKDDNLKVVLPRSASVEAVSGADILNVQKKTWWVRHPIKVYVLKVHSSHEDDVTLDIGGFPTNSVSEMLISNPKRQDLAKQHVAFHVKVRQPRRLTNLAVSTIDYSQMDHLICFGLVTDWMRTRMLHVADRKYTLKDIDVTYIEDLSKSGERWTQVHWFQDSQNRCLKEMRQTATNNKNGTTGPCLIRDFDAISERGYEGKKNRQQERAKI